MGLQAVLDSVLFCYDYRNINSTDAILTVARSIKWGFRKKLEGLLAQTKSFAACLPRCDVHHATKAQ